MGIGNTTAASAISAVLTAGTPEHVTGPGTGTHAGSAPPQGGGGAPGAATQRARPGRSARRAGKGGEASRSAYWPAWCWGRPAGAAPWCWTASSPAAAALLAQGLCPPVRDYLFAAHRSAEPGHRAVLARLGLDPLLDLELRLGEGTGALLALPIVTAAAACLTQMATFAQAGVSDRERYQ